MAWVFCSGSDAIQKAGINVNSTLSGSAILTTWSNEAEGLICNITRVDVVTNYGSLTAQGKQILGNLASSMIAQKAINYDPNAIGRSTATLRLNILENDIGRAIGLIKDDKVKSYLAVT